MNGVQVPTRIVQRQAGMATFEANITAATPNPSNLTELLTVPPPPARGGEPADRRGSSCCGPWRRRRPAARCACGRKLGDGAFKIGGNYAALAVDMGDHILVVESGGSDARGLEVMAAAKQAIPGKPVRFVVNSHPHFDHASGLAAAVAEGADPDAPEQRTGAGAAALRSADVAWRQPFEGRKTAYPTWFRASAIATCARKQRQGRRAASHPERAQRRHVRHLPARRKGALYR